LNEVPANLTVLEGEEALLKCSVREQKGKFLLQAKNIKNLIET
jgi:hypothetical protein